jgi:ABC-type dipeptide/oligopeptide/nickel transport system ATPase component
MSNELITASPYKGLRKFWPEDSALFFGRDKFSAQLANELERTNLVLLLGASGSGKSSVVMAGLVPLLNQRQESLFASLMFVPDRDPFESFYACLLGQGFSKSQAKLARAGEVNSLSQVVKQLKPSDALWLIFIDQFEELFTVSKTKERELFITSVVDLIQEYKTDPLVKIVVAMRSDFLDRINQLSDNRFAELIRQHQYVITPMNRNELRQVIEQPAAHHGVMLEVGLVDEILMDVEGQTNYLPILQYTLDLLWKLEVQNNGLQNRILETSFYRMLGGLRGSLQRHIEDIYSSFGAREQNVVRDIFLKLVALDGDGLSRNKRQFVGRRVSQSEFRENTELQVLQQLIDYCILVSYWSNSTGATVEIAQSILLTSWERLKSWLEDYHIDNYFIPQGFSNDLAKGPDLLDIEDEINALAEVLAMRDLQPPLAVGIFGSWGSGKSYVMHLMQQRINAIRGRKLLPERAWGDKSDVDVYVGHIYQIRFDAWTYAKADLWSSLMQTIFYEFNRQLTLEKQIAEALVRAEEIPISKITKLKSKVFWKNLKIRLFLDHFASQVSSDSPIPDKKALLQKKQLEGGQFWHVLNEMSESDRTLILQSNLSGETLKKMRESKSQKELTDYLWKRIAEIRQSEKQELKDKAQALKQEKQNLRFLILMRAPAYLLQRNWLLVITFIIGFAVIFYPLLPERTKNSIPEVFHDFLADNPFQRTLVGGISAFLTGKSLWDKTREEQEKILAVWKIGQETAQAQAKSVIDFSTAMYEDLLKSDSKIQKKVEDIKYLESQIVRKEKQLGLSSTFPSLNAFINDRLLTDSYSKQLGALQQVQRDLADLTTHFTFPSQGDLARTEFEDKLEKLRLVFPRGPARIVLYIDDLDRCPPEQVVNVLEAVQLLLKTPLFIVVLALDDRYIARALEKVYEGVLKRGGKPSGIDYLEKIIQIPYRVRPVSQSAIGKYLRAHMDIQEIDNRDVDIEENDEPGKPNNPNLLKKDLSYTSSATNVEPVIVPTSNLDSEDSDELVGSSSNSGQIAAQKNTPQSLKSEFKDLPIRVAKFTKKEFYILQTCCQQIELTPRTTKRLINIYKVLKIIWFRSISFESPEKEDDIKQVTIAFLALSGRYPHLIRRIFSGLEFRFEESSDLSHKLIDIFLEVIEINHSNYLGQERDKFQSDVEQLIPDISLKELSLENFRLILSFCFVGDIGYDPDDLI